MYYIYISRNSQEYVDLFLKRIILFYGRKIGEKSFLEFAGLFFLFVTTS